MNIFKTIYDMKALFCLGVLIALGTGFSAAADGAEAAVAAARPAPVEESSAAEEEPVAEEPVEEEEAEEEPYVMNAEAPEVSCPGFEVNGIVIFANRRGGYTMQDHSGRAARQITVECEGGELTVWCYADELTMSRDRAEVDGHLIELTDGVLYYDKSPVVYRDTAFSAYQLTEEYTVECTDVGKYILRKADGTTDTHCTITDDSGTKQEIYADGDGFMAVNPDDFLEIAFKYKKDLFGISGTLRLYINGAELVPPGYNDVYREGRTAPLTVSETPLEAQRPPTDYWAVRKDNEGVTELTLEMLGYVNEFRQKYGLGELYGITALDGAAQVRAEELTESYSHQRPDERSFETVLEDAGLLWWVCGENIAFTDGADALTIFDAWTRSEEHRANLLDPKAKYLAAAAAEDGGRVYYELLVLNDCYTP